MKTLIAIGGLTVIGVMLIYTHTDSGLIAAVITAVGAIGGIKASRQV